MGDLSSYRSAHESDVAFIKSCVISVFVGLSVVTCDNSGCSGSSGCNGGGADIDGNIVVAIAINTFDTIFERDSVNTCTLFTSNESIFLLFIFYWVSSGNPLFVTILVLAYDLLAPFCLEIRIKYTIQQYQRRLILLTPPTLFFPWFVYFSHTNELNIEQTCLIFSHIYEKGIERVFFPLLGSNIWFY